MKLAGRQQLHGLKHREMMAPYLQQSLRGWLHRGSQAGIARGPASPSLPSQLRMSQVIASAGPANGAPAKQPAPKGQGKGKKGRGKDADEESKSGPYSNTVFLPTTDFSLRANSIVREPQIQQWWEEQRIYEQLAEENPGEPFTLHDGPPYANGDLHIGHALNKILKDMINRYQLLRGKKAKFVPGWDTHGLPIELKVLQNLPDAQRKSLGTLELRQKAAEFALGQLDSQRTQFKRYGVWGHWQSPYVTLQPEYEAAQLGVFGKMFLNGHIYRGRKPVHWSPSSRTALAEAELEYPEGHKSPSIYVAMPLVSPGSHLPSEVAAHLQGAAFAIWTTTPWTIPANLAVAVNDQLEYALVAVQGEDVSGWAHKKLIVAKDLVEKLQETFGCDMMVLHTFKGKELEGCVYRHPFADRTSPLVIGGDYITTETGTGLVHTAPGHGAEDYQVGQRVGLPLLSPVDDAGRFTEEAGERFKGKMVLTDGNAEVVSALSEVGALLKEEQYEHKYPYDWRTKKPTIFRATSQWFASVSGFRDSALGSIQQVSWVPSSGQARITSMTEGRGDWCISRQRKWGVPIPVFYNIETDEPLMTEETISHITSLVSQHGSDVWWSKGVEDLLPPTLKHLAPTLRKGEDTMDVWFDSGSSWAGVLQTRGLNFPADLYLEGSDQHRGWFQSSLLTSVAATGQAPYKQVLTHGFVLDEKGNKMSKSLGNVVDPRIVIQGGKDERKDPAYGADVLRMWVASVDYSSDVMIGAGILKQVFEAYRKMRGTLRFVLGNLSGFDPKVNAVPYDQLPSLDKFMLSRIAALQTEVAAAYDSYAFNKIFGALQRFVAQDCSSFYLDVAKDRLYIRSENDPARRSCQTVLYALLRVMLSALAPIAPHTSEDAWLNTPKALQGDQASVFKAGWFQAPTQWSSGFSQDESNTWAALLTIRDAVNATMEKARAAKELGASLEARVVLSVSDPSLAERLTQLNSSANGVDELKTVFIVSQVDLVSDAATAQLCPFHETVTLDTPQQGAGDNGSTPAASSQQAPVTVTIGVARAGGSKCARCWNYSDSVGSHEAAVTDGFKDLCDRCYPVIKGLGFKLPAAAAAAPEPAVPV